MRIPRLACAALATTLLLACGDDDDDGGNNPDAALPDAGQPDAGEPFGVNSCASLEADPCVEIEGGDVQTLLDTANSLEGPMTIVLGRGTFAMGNALTIRSAGAHVIGQGIDATTLDYGDATVQANGIDVVGDDFLVQDLTVLDSGKDGIRVESSNGVVFRRIRATWSTPGETSNGAYGIYPVKSKNVLVEDSRAENASDAGLYVGQCENVIVRNNIVRGNVAGLEIENTQYADVYGNLAEDNTGGIVVFDLPGNPIVGRDVRLRDNTIKGNNRINFGSPGTTVASIPVGTGTFAMASRRVEITGNTYEDNWTVDIAIISGLAIEPDTTKWELATANLVGDWEDLGLLPAGEGKITNFRGENILVAGNTHKDSGTMPDGGDPLHLGILLGATYASKHDGAPVDSVLYDTIGESAFDPTDAQMNSNDNHICVGGNTDGTFASLDLEHLDLVNLPPFFRPASPFAPFDCTALIGEPVAEVVLP